MAYTLNYSGGTITVADGTLNTTNTSLSLPGRNYAGYGSPVDQNMVSLLENFAYYTASPPNAIKGQIWFDTTTNQLKYNIGVFGSPNWVAVAQDGGTAAFTDITVTGNVTAGGTVSGSAVTAPVITATSNFITGVEGGITATGINQAGAYGLTKDINVVTTATTGVADGVRLPTTSSGGNRITVMNLSGNTVKVYPSGASQINSLGATAAYTLVAGGRLDFVSISNSQWYTLNATYG